MNAPDVQAYLEGKIVRLKRQEMEAAARSRKLKKVMNQWIKLGTAIRRGTKKLSEEKRGLNRRTEALDKGMVAMNQVLRGNE